MSQYYENDEALPHKRIVQHFTLLGEEFSLESDLGVFSKKGIDEGSQIFLETIAKLDLGKNILDLGCGIGTLGLLLAHFDENRRVSLSDVNRRALALTQKNAAALGVADRIKIIESDVYDRISEKYDAIVTNPPIRAGKKITYAIYEGAPSHLRPGGKLLLVIRKQQGADSCRKYLETLFPEVSELGRKKGYRILIAH